MRAALAALVVLFGGCSSLKPYPSVAPENVVVKSALESGSILSSMRGSVHIHELDAVSYTHLTLPTIYSV